MAFQGYTVSRVGSYKIIEGVGRFGGLWAASTKGELKVFNNRKLAEEHAELSAE